MLNIQVLMDLINLVYCELEKEIDLTFEWLIRYESGQESYYFVCNLLKGNAHFLARV